MSARRSRRRLAHRKARTLRIGRSAGVSSRRIGGHIATARATARDHAPRHPHHVGRRDGTGSRRSHRRRSRFHRAHHPRAADLQHARSVLDAPRAEPLRRRSRHDPRRALLPRRAVRRDAHRPRARLHLRVADLTPIRPLRPRSDRSVLAFRLRNPDAPNGAGDFSAALLHHTGELRLKARRSPHHPGPRGRLPIDAVMPKSERGARGVTTRTSPEHVLGAADTHRRRCDGMHTAVATVAVLR